MEDMNTKQQTHPAGVISTALLDTTVKSDHSTAIQQLDLEEMTAHFREKGVLWPSPASIRAAQKQSLNIKQSK